MESGNLTEWSRYHAGYFASINRMFEESKGEEFVYVREHLKLSLEVISQWDPWGVCQICGRAKGDAIRKKRGYCRIKLTTNSNEKKATDVKNKLDPDVSYLLNSPAISCRSMRLKNVLPGQYNSLIYRILCKLYGIKICKICIFDFIFNWQFSNTLINKYKHLPSSQYDVFCVKLTSKHSISGIDPINYICREFIQNRCFAKHYSKSHAKILLKARRCDTTYISLFL